jgi:hypothetical protein
MSHELEDFRGQQGGVPNNLFLDIVHPEKRRY